MKHTITGAVFLVLTTLAAPAFAIFKCETGGKVTYSDEACPGGKVLDVNTSAATKSPDGNRQLAQEKSKLKRLEKERHRREAKEERERRGAARASAARQKKCAALARRQKRAAENVSRSVGKANEKARLKLRHITEDYEAECGRWPERELSVAR